MPRVLHCSRRWAKAHAELTAGGKGRRYLISPPSTRDGRARSTVLYLLYFFFFCFPGKLFSLEPSTGRGKAARAYEMETQNPNFLFLFLALFIYYLIHLFLFFFIYRSFRHLFSPETSTERGKAACA